MWSPLFKEKAEGAGFGGQKLTSGHVSLEVTLSHLSGDKRQGVFWSPEVRGRVRLGFRFRFCFYAHCIPTIVAI